MSLPLMLYAYRALTWALGPVAALMLRSRADHGKEDAGRLGERFGRYSKARPDGPLVWMHGASVGESLILLTLIDAIRAERGAVNVLVTTGTLTSADLVARRAPEGVIHQFLPIDRPGPVRRFLKHWRPDAAVFAESEIWPNLILETQARGIPMVLVNARMNDGSLARWLRWKTSGQALLSAYSWIGAADRRTADGLTKILDTEIPLAGNLKLDAPALLADQSELTALRTALAGRNIWLAASTHEGEETVVLAAHQTLADRHDRPLLILAPRHPERGDALAAQITAGGFTMARRSSGEVPDADSTVWLADTLGEMPLWYGLAPAALIGGSLIDGIGGHNPIEASKAGASIISGPFTASFDDVYAAYRQHDAAIFASDAEAIADAVDAIWSGKGPQADAVTKALTVASGGALKITMSAIRPIFAGSLS
ncbi:3-deoxy-D-manno-octulosonic acid transferase [Hyphobacterium marinum]|uniref:3-deoxy-D-manno-octulosonic acid transferase n=1 Tax=Hyphobacterium marinum TaxID=3116574 RepID=A0ABU7LWR5_9PROT|nr:3-deoxy-D-manno-octulosonic acid transferase [Hyphobacterium sp. Y6023]MEE2565970.1 3-deoxy-D-manno-octulosonic acid transferase [Hyphobacterium sp. Y6023]